MLVAFDEHGYVPEVMATAARMAARKRRGIHVLVTISVPASSPIDVDLPQQQALAESIIEEAKVQAGRRVSGHWEKVRAGQTGRRIVDEARAMLVIGLCAILTAAVVGHHLPSSPPQVKAHFAWVSRPTFHGLARAAGVAMGLAGMGLDLALFVAEQHHADIPLYQRITWAGTAQSLILSAILLLAFSLLYRLLARSGRATAPQPDEDTPWYGS